MLYFFNILIIFEKSVILKFGYNVIEAKTLSLKSFFINFKFFNISFLVVIFAWLYTETFQDKTIFFAPSIYSIFFVSVIKLEYNLIPPL